MLSDATVTTIVTGIVTIVTLWWKSRVDANKTKRAADAAASRAEEAVNKASVVEGKIDANTITTNAVHTNTDTIVKQTNGSLESIKEAVRLLNERVEKLEDYNRDSSHRMLNAINDMHLKVAQLLALQPKPSLPEPKDSK